MKLPDSEPIPSADIIASLKKGRGDDGVDNVTDIWDFATQSHRARPSVRPVILIAGLPASGKSTLIEAMEQTMELELITFESALGSIRSERPNRATYATDYQYEFKYRQFFEHGSLILEQQLETSIKEGRYDPRMLVVVAPVFTGRVTEGGGFKGVDTGSRLAYRLAKRMGRFEGLDFELFVIALVRDDEIGVQAEFARDLAQKDAGQARQMGITQKEIDDTLSGHNATKEVVARYDLLFTSEVTDLVGPEGLPRKSKDTPLTIYVRDQYIPYYLGPKNMDLEKNRKFVGINYYLLKPPTNEERVA